MTFESSPPDRHLASPAPEGRERDVAPLKLSDLYDIQIYVPDHFGPITNKAKEDSPALQPGEAPEPAKGPPAAKNNSEKSPVDIQDNSKQGVNSARYDPSRKMSLDADLTSKDVLQFFNRNFSALDKDKSGAITINELRSFIPATAQESKSQQYLEENINAIEKLNYDGLFTNGITRADMEQFAIQADPAYPARVADMQQMSDNFAHFFNKVDQDDNGRLSKGELESAANNPSLSAEEKHTAQFLAQGFDTLTAQLHDGLFDHNAKLGFSRDDMNILNQKFSVDNSAQQVQTHAFKGEAIGALGTEVTAAAIVWEPIELGTAAFFGSVAAPIVPAAALGYYYQKERTLNQNNASRIDVWNIFEALDKSKK